ncbi:MAG: alpha-L-fucosidase [Spirochaetes bacterium]|nr:alpha-L-fucosidase [Spirochaetota bacterium]
MSTTFPTPEQLAAEQRKQAKYPEYRGVDSDYVHASEQGIDKFLDRKFGLRIHWGPYCMFNFRESWGLPNAGHERHAEYEKRALSWNPQKFNADEWMAMMKNGGVQFFSFTTKHHDGFSMYDTKTRIRRRMGHEGADRGRIVDSDLAYSIMETPFKRDVVRELVDAGRRHDLGIGLYYSHIDWLDMDFRCDQWNPHLDNGYTPQNDPDGYARMIARHREQLRELCANYGPLDVISLDMNLPDEKFGFTKDIIETVKMMRRLQPDALIRNRGIGAYGDHHTPERKLPSEKEAGAVHYDQLNLAKMGRPWKAIYPGSINFSYMSYDEYKPGEWIIDNLVDATAKGGTFQVGYGPAPDGTFHADVKNRFEYTGAWLRAYGEAIYATRPFDTYQEGRHVRYTKSKDGKSVYAIFLRWPSGHFVVESLKLAALAGKKVASVSLLGTDEKLKFKQDENGVSTDIPAWFRDEEKRPSRKGAVLKFTLA